MEMSYDYFKQLIAFASQNDYKKYDLPFTYFTIERTKALYPKVGYNPFLVFRFDGVYHKSDSIPAFTFHDVIELYQNYQRMIDENMLPCYHSFFDYKIINGNCWLMFNDHIEVWKEESVKIEQYVNEKGVKVMNVTTPKFRE